MQRVQIIIYHLSWWWKIMAGYYSIISLLLDMFNNGKRNNFFRCVGENIKLVDRIYRILKLRFSKIAKSWTKSFRAQFSEFFKIQNFLQARKIQNWKNWLNRKNSLFSSSTMRSGTVRNPQLRNFGIPMNVTLVYVILQKLCSPIT